MYGYDYYTFTGTQGVGYYQPVNALANSASVTLVSNYYSTESELGIYLQNIKRAITTTMTSFTNWAHGELVI